MFAALRATSREEELARRQPFSLAAFCDANPDTAGLLHPAAGRPTETLGLVEMIRVDDDDDEIFSPYFDDETRKITVSLATPPAATRTATELLLAVHFAALARDNPRRCPPGADEDEFDANLTEMKKIEQLMARAMTERQLRLTGEGIVDLGGASPSNSLRQTVTEALTERFQPPPKETEVERVVDLLFLSKALFEPIAGPVRSIVEDVAKNCTGVLNASTTTPQPRSAEESAAIAAAGGDADNSTNNEALSAPKEPLAFFFGVVELLRLRLLRAVIDGNMPEVLKRGAVQHIKLIRKLSGSAALKDGEKLQLPAAESTAASVMGFFPSPEAYQLHASVLERLAGDASSSSSHISSRTLLLLYRVEVIIAEIQRQRGAYS